MAKRKTVQLKKALIEMISTQRMAGNKLPPEEVLAKSFGVSRGTIREVIGTLVSDGVVSKRHGMGNFVHRSALTTPMRIDTIRDFNLLISSGGYAAERILIGISDEAEIDDRFFDEIKQALHVKTRKDLCSLENLYLADDAPAIYSQVFYPRMMVQKNHSETGAKTLFDFMQDVCGQSIDQTIIHFIPTGASEHVAETLRLHTGTPLLLWEEHYYNFFDELVCASLTYFHPEIMHLTMLRK